MKPLTIRIGSSLEVAVAMFGYLYYQRTSELTSQSGLNPKSTSGA